MEFSGRQSKYIPGQGGSNAKLMIVGEYPGTLENNTGESIAGHTASFLKDTIESKGLQWSSTYRTTIFKRKQFKAKKVKNVPTQDNIDSLWSEIRGVNPNAILALGNTALSVLTGKEGIDKYRGSILLGIEEKVKVIPTIHPGSLFFCDNHDGEPRPYSSKQYISLDIKRAVTESFTKELVLPERNLQIAKNAKDVYDFFELYKSISSAGVDIESLRGVPTCISFCFTPNHSISIPLRSFLSSYESIIINESDLDEIWLMVYNKLNDPNFEIIGQNFKYDHEKMIWCGLMEKRDIHADISHMAHTCHSELPKALAFTTSIYTREPYYKDEGKDYDPSKDSPERLLIYNAKDAAVTKEIYTVLRSRLEQRGLWKFYLRQRQPLHRLYINIEEHGFCVDEKRREELIALYKERLSKTEEELFEIVGHTFNINSPKQVAEVIFTELGFPKREKCDEDTLIALAGNHGTTQRKSKGIYLLLESRRIRRTLSNDLAALPDWDGYMRSSWNICGSETGRSSTSNLDEPLRQQLWIIGKKSGKEVAVKKSLGIAAQTLAKHGENKKIRSIYIPPKGKIFWEVDLSQAEPRIVALLSRDEWLLQAFSEGRDVHSETATWFFNVAVECITKEMRFIGKGGRNGGAYGQGKRRLALTINTDAKKYGIDITVSEKRAGEISDIFHAKSPSIRNVYHREVQEAISRDRKLRNPYGRERLFFDRMGDSIFQEGYADIPQSTVRDHVIGTLVYLDKYHPKIEIVCETHDGFLGQSDIGLEKEHSSIAAEHLQRPIDFSLCTLQRGMLRIPADIQFGENYADLKKAKI